MRNNTHQYKRSPELLPELVLPDGYFHRPLFDGVPDPLWHEVKAAVRAVAAGARQSQPSRGVVLFGPRKGLPAGIVAVRFADTVIVVFYPDAGEAREIVRLDCAEFRECS